MACLSSIALILFGQAYLLDNAIAQSSNNKTHSPKKLTDANIKKKAERITVQIKTIQNKSIGTAVIVGKKEFITVLQKDKSPQYLYDVLTAHHVIKDIKKRAEEIVVITPDKIQRNVSLKSATQIETNDLAVFHIVSANDYPTAKLGNSDNLDRVFSAGFPCEEDFCNDELEFTSGITAPDVILEGYRSFRGGFKIGHDSKLYDGMSGSPILDVYGSVVGINSRKKYPPLIFANNKYRYPDGSTPSKDIQEFIPYFAWGIAIEEYVEFKHNKKKSGFHTSETNKNNNSVSELEKIFINLDLEDENTLILILLIFFCFFSIIILVLNQLFFKRKSKDILALPQSTENHNNDILNQINNSELDLIQNKIKICEIEIIRSNNQVLFIGLLCLDGQDKYIEPTPIYPFWDVLRKRNCYQGYYQWKQFFYKYEINLIGSVANKNQISLEILDSNIFVEVEKTKISGVYLEQKVEYNKEVFSIIVNEEMAVDRKNNLPSITLKLTDKV